MYFNKISITLSTLLLSTTLFSQCLFNSSNGYTVSVSIAPINMLVTNTGGDCVYRTVMQYDIQFSGTNIPASLFTMQGRVTCFGIDRTYDLPNNGGVGTVNSANFSGPFIAGNCSGYSPSGCTIATIIIQGPGIPYQEVPCNFADFSMPLPIELINFSTTENEGMINLEWSTASERNNDYFTIEHSTDGITYSIIDKISGAGTTSEQQDYSLNNVSYSSGINYYKLTQTDFDGTITQLKIISITKEQQSEFLVYPNPTNDRTITIEFPQAEAQITYNIYSMMGQLLSSQKIENISKIEHLQLPQNGNSFYIEIINDKEVLGREIILAN